MVGGGASVLVLRKRFFMDQNTAKQALFKYLTARQQAERARAALGPERERWRTRANLAREKGAADLAAAANDEIQRLEEKEAALAAEIAQIDGEIASLRAEQNVARAQERSVDPDALEAALQNSLGRGTEDAEQTRRLQELEKLQREAEAETALAALKAQRAGAGTSAPRTDTA
jgi:phage shock protein A